MNILRIIPLFILVACGDSSSSTGRDGPGSSGGGGLGATTSDPTTPTLPTTTGSTGIGSTTVAPPSSGEPEDVSSTTTSDGTTAGSGSAGDTSSGGDASSTGIDAPEQICFGDACEVDADCGPNFVCLEHPHTHALMCVAGCFGLGGCGDILATLNCGAFAPQEPLAECLKLDDGRACFPRPCETLDDCPAKAIACVGGLCL